MRLLSFVATEFHKTFSRRQPRRSVKVPRRFRERVERMRLVSFAATEFHKTFSGRQPRRSVKVPRRFRERLRPHLQGVAETSVNLHVSTRLFVRERFIE
jgi:hypothetical protein